MLTGPQRKIVSVPRKPVYLLWTKNNFPRLHRTLLGLFGMFICYKAISWQINCCKVYIFRPPVSNKQHRDSIIAVSTSLLSWISDIVRRIVHLLDSHTISLKQFCYCGRRMHALTVSKPERRLRSAAVKFQVCPRLVSMSLAWSHYSHDTVLRAHKHKVSNHLYMYARPGSVDIAWLWKHALVYLLWHELQSEHTQIRIRRS